VKKPVTWVQSLYTRNHSPLGSAPEKNALGKSGNYQGGGGVTGGKKSGKKMSQEEKGPHLEK